MYLNGFRDGLIIISPAILNHAFLNKTTHYHYWIIWGMVKQPRDEGICLQNYDSVSWDNSSEDVLLWYYNHVIGMSLSNHRQFHFCSTTFQANKKIPFRITSRLHIRGFHTWLLAFRPNGITESAFMSCRYHYTNRLFGIGVPIMCSKPDV